MKTTIISLIIVVTLSLTACTGKEPPVVMSDDGSNVNSSQDEGNSSESDVLSQDEGSSSESDVSSQAESNSSESDVSSHSDNNSEETNPIPNDTQVSTGALTEMPQEVLDFAKANNMEITNEISDLYRIYIDEANKFVPIGAILDLTNEQEPKILYHHIQNAEGQILQEGEGMSGAGMLGGVYVVKFNEDGKISEFFKWEREIIGSVIDEDKDPLYVYGSLQAELNK